MARKKEVMVRFTDDEWEQVAPLIALTTHKEAAVWARDACLLAVVKAQKHAIDLKRLAAIIIAALSDKYTIEEALDVIQQFIIPE